jgi:hypothetical protein
MTSPHTRAKNPIITNRVLIALVATLMILWWMDARNNDKDVQRAYMDGLVDGELAGLKSGKIEAYKYLSENKYSAPLVENYCREHN